MFEKWFSEHSDCFAEFFPFALNNFLLANVFQALIIRDYWLLTVISVLFEVLEYSLEHQLPNFSECWWDHVSLVYIRSLQYSSFQLTVVKSKPK